jgi:hypothetical protein
MGEGLGGGIVGYAGLVTCLVHVGYRGASVDKVEEHVAKLAECRMSIRELGAHELGEGGVRGGLPREQGRLATVLSGKETS